MTRFLEWIYERLTLRSAPEPADVIFVLAGKMERKRYGVELYDAGIATRLLLSVGRFEIGKIGALQLPFVAELTRKRDSIPPRQRHFFCVVDRVGTRIMNPHLHRWNTWGEVVAFREHLASNPATRVIVVSTDIHLRRVALTFRSVFGASGEKFVYCPVPEAQSSVSKNGWWTRGNDRRYVIAETVKLIAYRVILLLPEVMIRWCMGLPEGLRLRLI